MPVTVAYNRRERERELNFEKNSHSKPRVGSSGRNMAKRKHQE